MLQILETDPIGLFILMSAHGPAKVAGRSYATCQECAVFHSLLPGISVPPVCPEQPPV